ncbi:phage virion morphogenesis protein [Celerinatantimonas sp. MCCC 1A17872]|uniref:phage virion morphogenesis protein n=1 Tax=Celerinatantimonas sp. MCCC 1A17872 TaxID=3177514 RepID=UPI0038C11367
MTNNLTALEDWTAPILNKLAPAERRNKLRQIGQQIRKQQQSRISNQQNPDGTPFAPRKGRIKRKMFTKLKQAKWMKVQAKDDIVTIGYTGRTAKIARVHQYGLTDKPSPKSRSIRYRKREVLGVNKKNAVQQTMLQHINLSE